MQKIKAALILLTLSFFSLTSLSSYSQELPFSERALKTIEEISDYKTLIGQINAEKKDKIGYEARALKKQLAVNEEAYRNLLWQFSDDLLQPENISIKTEHQQFIISLLADESTVLKQEIDQNSQTVAGLEQRIIDAKKKIFTTNQAISKDRLADIKWRLYLERLNQEQLYTALVKNALRLDLFGENATDDLSLGKLLVQKQADMLSGMIGDTRDKLIKLDKQISVIRNESETGKKIITDIALKNVDIQNYARRLQNMVGLLTDMNVDSSLYKKTIIQSQNIISTDIFDRKVASHLFTEWWLKTKKWFSQQAPTILGKTITFISILLIAWFIAAIVKRMVRGLFKRTNPNMSELAKNFLIGVSSKLIMLIGFLIALSNLGIQIGPILAGLGIMGFIIGFAFQETLSNFASGLMILIYRPYDVGDKIRISGLEGKVNKMNLVSTTIFTSANHHLTIPNNKIWKDIIHNITSQPLVRMDLFFTAPFNAASDTVLALIRDEVESNPIVIKDKPKNVHIQELEEDGVKYIARFWINSDDIDETRWVIAEGVKKRFDANGISEEIIESLKVRIA